MTVDEEIKMVEREIEELKKTIDKEIDELKNLDDEIELIKLDAELEEHQIRFIDMQIQELILDFDAEEGEKILREEYPNIADDILQSALPK